MTLRLVGRDLEIATVRDLIVRRAVLGEKPFLYIDDEMLTYREADIRSNRFANTLAGLNVSKGDVVSTFLHNSLDHACIWFACAKLGAIFAPLNVSLQAVDLEYSLKDTTAQILILEEELLPKYLGVRGRLDIRHEVLLGDPRTAEQFGMMSAEVLYSQDASLPSVEILPSDPIGIVYTGGSTGLPKGVLVPHLYHLAFATRYREISESTPADVMYESGHIFHSGGQQLGVIGPMFSEMTSVMTRWFSVSRLWPIINKHRATLVHVPGAMLGPILDRTPKDGGPDHPIRLAVGMGTGQIRPAIREEFERRFGFPLLEVYGQTEMGAMFLSERVNEQRQGSSGHSYGWAEIRVADEEDRSLPPNTEGQILIRPAEPYTFMLEYFNKPEATARSWRNLWHHTGDIGYLDEDGFLFFKGRQAFWIRRRAENISAFEVEQTITAHPSVAECAAVGVPSELGEEEIKVYIVVRDGHGVNPQEIVSWCADRVAYFKVPRYIEFVDEVPRTAAKGDIDRNKLRGYGIRDAWDREAKAE